MLAPSLFSPRNPVFGLWPTLLPPQQPCRPDHEDPMTKLPPFLLSPTAGFPAASNFHLQMALAAQEPFQGTSAKGEQTHAFRSPTAAGEPSTEKNGDRMECPICREVLDNDSLQLHLFKEMEQMFSKETQLTARSSPDVENSKEPPTVTSKSRFEQFLQIRQNRLQRIQNGRSFCRRKRTYMHASGGLADVSSGSISEETRSGSCPEPAYFQGKDEEEVDVTEELCDRYGQAQYSPSDVAAFSCAKRARLSEGHHELPTCPACYRCYDKPLVSVQCWHVLCEVCWIDVLKTKKLCPVCKSISSSDMLRKIFL